MNPKHVVIIALLMLGLGMLIGVKLQKDCEDNALPAAVVMLIAFAFVAIFVYGS